jgi:hypothetical protein
MCSDINYDLLGGQAGGEPSEGTYQATLIRAQVIDTSKGSSLITEWSTSENPAYYWSTWFGFSANRITVTNEFLDAIGVDRASIMRGGTQDERDEELTRQLWTATNQAYTVEVTKWSGGVNTKVVAAPAPDVSIDQTAMWEAPIQSGGPPAPVGAGAGGRSEDDDIPF